MGRVNWKVGKESKKYRNIKILSVGTILTFFLLRLAGRYLYGSGLSRSIWGILILLLICTICREYEKVRIGISQRKRNFLLTASMLFSVAEVAGIYLTSQGSVLAYSISGFLLECLEFVSMSVTMYFLLAAAVQQIEWTDIWKRSVIEIGDTKKGSLLADLFTILMGWIPVLLAYYPGVFAYDAADQIMQVVDGKYMTHHPLVHTLLLGKFFELGRMIGGNATGILLYSIFQMGTLAFVFAWTIRYMRKRGMGRTGHLLTLAFYALFPVNSVLALSTAKDILFAAFALVVLVTLTEMVGNPDHGVKKSLSALGIAALAGMVLFRNNALYACIVACPLMCLVDRTRWKQYFGFILTGLLSAVCISHGLNVVLEAEKDSIVYMMNVPLQQMARAGNGNHLEMEGSLWEELCYFIPEDAVFDYGPNIADGVITAIEEKKIKEGPTRFLKVYVKLGLAYPREYIDAFASLTQGFWYMEDTSHAKVYGEGMESRLGYMLTNYKRMPEGYEVEHVSYFPQLEYVLEKLFSDNKYLDFPLLPVFFAPAFYGWMLVGYVMIILYCRKYQMLIPVLILLCYHGTLLLGPTCIIRYVYPVVACLPCMVFLIKGSGTMWTL